MKAESGVANGRDPAQHPLRNITQTIGLKHLGFRIQVWTGDTHLGNASLEIFIFIKFIGMNWLTKL